MCPGTRDFFVFYFSLTVKRNSANVEKAAGIARLHTPNEILCQGVFYGRHKHMSQDNMLPYIYIYLYFAC